MMDFADRIFIGSYVSDKKQRSGERAEEPALEDRHFPRVLQKSPLWNGGDGVLLSVDCICQFGQKARAGIVAIILDSHR